MTVRTKERRAHRRAAVACPLVLLDRRGRPCARGRTANISAGGVYAIVRGGRDLRVGQVVRARIDLPAADRDRKLRGRRTVRYRSRVVRVAPLGGATGVALQFIGKIR
jgi:c-di-GMP-binding flagellar brake protein YcgR